MVKKIYYIYGKILLMTKARSKAKQQSFISTASFHGSNKNNHRNNALLLGVIKVV